jgi:hypothetical protein
VCQKVLAKGERQLARAATTFSTIINYPPVSTNIFIHLLEIQVTAEIYRLDGKNHRGLVD